MSSEQAAYDIIKALFDADAGAGGLANTNSLNTAYVRGGMFRRGDPQSTYALPHIQVEVFDSEADTTGKSRTEVLVRLTLVTDSNLSYLSVVGSQGGIASRIRAAYHRITPSANNGWNPSILRRVRSFQGPQGDGKNQQIHEFRFFMQRSSHG